MIDLDFVKNLPVPTFATPVIHLQNAVTKHCLDAYQADLRFFEASPHRKLHIRGAFPGELTDAAMPIEEFMSIPQMQVLVMQLSVGEHLCMYVFLGRKLTQHVQAKTDADVRLCLLKMQQHGGMGHEEWNELCEIAQRNQQQMDTLQACPTSNQKVN